MQHTTGFLDGSPSLFWRLWRPDSEVVASIALVHGINEHSGRYAYMASRLMLRGIEVHAFDYRGHGKSDGARGEIEEWSDLHEDMDRFVAHVKESAAPVPRFLMGHSMGGLICAGWWADHQPEGFDGLILSSPALALPPVPSLLSAIAPVVAKRLPRMHVTKVDLAQLSRDPLVGEQYANDELVNSTGVKARIGWGIVQEGERVAALTDRFSCPLYLFHGADDKITSPPGTERLAETAPSSDITFRLWQGLRHETLNEPERDEVIDALADWILARV